MSDVIPFGKYRGQPVEALASDQQYADWLVAQPWFRAQYANIYNVVINNFSSGSEDTPQHNAKQALFLNGEFCVRFIKVAIPKWPRNLVISEIDELSRSIEGFDKKCIKDTW